MLKIFVEIESRLVFDAFLNSEDVILHHALLSSGDVQLVDEVVASGEHLGVNDLVQFFFGVLQLVFQIQQLHVLRVEQVLVLQNQ